MIWNRKTTDLPTAENALAGRGEPSYEISGVHAVNGHAIIGPFPENLEQAYFAMGCFWGAERLFWNVPGVWSTSVGYTGGTTPNPTYEETCSGRTGHAEAVSVVFDPQQVSYRDLLQVFFDEHDPTQGMRQGNDVGTQYRSAIYWTTESQRREAVEAIAAFDKALADAGMGPVTTDLEPAGTYYPAEEYHQQYLHKNPNGYCGLKGTGVTCALPRNSSEPASDADQGLKPVPTSDEEWRQRLSPAQFEVLRQAGTERAFTGEYTDVTEEGTYRCAGCGNPLHTSESKFHSGCGWPSFTEAVSPDAVELLEDTTHGMTRTEVRCSRCGSHLGHVFPDGPRDRGGMRYCINSLSLDLDPS